MCLLTFIGCDAKPKVRHYTEITLESKQVKRLVPQSAMNSSMSKQMPTANNVIKDKITWKLPQGWVARDGGSMRLVTLNLKDNPDLFDCSIVALPGDAGGLHANLKRWMGQINLNVTDKDFDHFVMNTSDNIFDFGRLQKNQPQTAMSMITAMLNVGGTTVFVKMNAPQSAIKKHKNAFLELVKSVQLQ